MSVMKIDPLGRTTKGFYRKNEPSLAWPKSGGPEKFSDRHVKPLVINVFDANTTVASVYPVTNNPALI
jgi:hypothetical protein